jgi:hypothetical protein
MGTARSFSDNAQVFAEMLFLNPLFYNARSCSDNEQVYLQTFFLQIKRFNF